MFFIYVRCGLNSSSVETNTSGASTASRSYHAYDSTRASSGTLQTDRTFTGHKQDGTGLLYYNARFYDPALGTFLSPDTLVPDAGRVVDYNRFLYVRGNPLNYSDPSGHCALLDDGSRSAEDAECWKAADDIYNLWPGGEDWWSGLFRMDRDSWMEIIGGNPGTDAAYMQGHLERYWWDFEFRTGLNRPVSLEPAPPHPIEATSAALRDLASGRCEIVDCTGLAIDAVGLASTIGAIGASPICGPAAPACAFWLKVGGTSIGTTASIGGFGRLIARATDGKASSTDVTVGTASFVLSFTPVSPASGFSQIIYDIFVSPQTMGH